MIADLVAFVGKLSVTRILGMGFLAFALGAIVGLAYRTYVSERVPPQVPVIVGLGAIGLWMNTASVLVGFVATLLSEEPGLLVIRHIETNLVAIAVGGVAASVGARAGDRLTPNVLALTGAGQVDTEVSRIVRTVGRFITVTVPKAKDIADIEGYEPVPDGTKEGIAGVELVFPRGLTIDELRRRLVARLKEDYGVGHVDVELTDDGAIEYLAIGSRAAGIGPTLPPRTVAVAVTANPAPNASPGDRVQVWERTDEGSRRIAAAELRATSGDVATLAVDANRIDAIDGTTTYDLVTLPAEKRPEREFAALLRTANETMRSVTVAPESLLLAVPVGALTPSVVAIRPEAGVVETLPGRSRTFQPGDTLFVIGRHDELRKLEAMAAPPDAGSPAAAVSGDDPTATVGPAPRSRLGDRVRRAVETLR